MIFRQATVIDNEDEKELGRIQVRFLPELEGVDDDLLPWAFPDKVSSNGTADGVGEVIIPEVDSTVRVVIFDEELHDIRYLRSGEFIASLFPRVKFDEDFLEIRLIHNLILKELLMELYSFIILRLQKLVFNYQLDCLL